LFIFFFSQKAQLLLKLLIDGFIKTAEYMLDHCWWCQL